MTLSICFISDALAEHTRRWTKYFALKGHQVNLITLNSKTLDDYEPVRLHVIKKPRQSSDVLSRAYNLPAVLFEVRRIIRDISPDVLHVHSAGPLSWLAMLTGFHPRVVTPWGDDILIDTKKSRWNRMITTMALRRADLITCDADHMKRKMVELGVREDKIEIVIFGVDLRRFKPFNEKDENLRKEFALGKTPVVISARTLTPIHDIETSIRAFALVKQAVPEASFIVAADGSERPKLESLVDSLGIRESTRFVGYLTEDEMAAWLRVADVYVSSSLSDAGLSGSTAEAMATGLPVVVTDNGDNRDWVAEGLGGFLVPNRDYRALADRIVRLLNDEELRLQFGHYNRPVIEERNNYVKEMDRMEAIYRELINHSR